MTGDNDVLCQSKWGRQLTFTDATMSDVTENYAPATLGWWMDERRSELGLTWKQAAETVGLSDQSFYRAARGNAIRTNTKKKIERAFRWASGSVDRIADGGEPVPLAEPPPTSADPDIHEWSAETRQRMATMTMQEVVQRLREEEEAHGEAAAEWLMREITRVREEAKKGYRPDGSN